ncbi:MAG: phosphoenolpyruvate--protein phosphotransferase [Myxococcota bacterium]
MSERPSELRGLPASPGIAIGPAYVLRRERLVIPERYIAREEVEGEIERLHRAFAETRETLDGIREGLEPTGLVGSIFQAQFLFLEDPTLIDNAVNNIRDNLLNAEWALQRERRRLQRMFEAIPDPYIRERGRDVGFVVRRVLQALMGREPEGLGNAPSGVIVVAEDLSPGEVAQVTRDTVAGLVTEGGSRTSHVTIMARTLEIPAVVGVAEPLVSELSDGMTLILDGRNGRILIDPAPEIVAEYQKQLSDYQVLTRDLLRYVDLPAETRDGMRVRMMANVDQISEIPDALRYGAEGIGLYRTEFLFMNRHDLPSEEEQFQAYRGILEAIAPRAAVVRTLDLGGEKVITGLDLTAEPNPALGLRGVRMSFGRPEIFRTQLRALLRASRYGSLKVLLPMVSSLVEVDFARRIFGEVAEELESEGVEIEKKVPLGIMIETPAAAMIADLIAPKADFLSIGTNDLIQYTLAVDRTNEQVAYLYEPLHPANIRMIQQITRAGRAAGIPVVMCGEMAGDPLHSWILMALGIGELSMTPFSIPLLKKILRDSTASEARELLSSVIDLGSAEEIRARVEERMRLRFPLEIERMVATG